MIVIHVSRLYTRWTKIKHLWPQLPQELKHDVVYCTVCTDAYARGTDGCVIVRCATVGDLIGLFDRHGDNMTSEEILRNLIAEEYPTVQACCYYDVKRKRACEGHVFIQRGCLGFCSFHRFLRPMHIGVSKEFGKQEEVNVLEML